MAQVTLVYAGDDVEAAEAALSPFLEIGPVLDQQAQLVPYPAIVAPPGNQHRGQGLVDSHSGLLHHVTAPAATAMAKMIRSGDVLVMQFRSVGGAVNDVARDETAYPHRTQNFSVLAATVPQRRSRLDRLWAGLYPHLDGMYLSFEVDTAPERLLDAFPEPTLGRLRALKAVYDPDNVFDRNFPIPPADTADQGGDDGSADEEEPAPVGETGRGRRRAAVGGRPPAPGSRRRTLCPPPIRRASSSGQVPGSRVPGSRVPGSRVRRPRRAGPAVRR
ncbi:BBE domain-containing protein [Plantactinospora veratri]